MTDNCVSGSYAVASRVAEQEGELLPENDDMGGDKSFMLATQSPASTAAHVDQQAPPLSFSLLSSSMKAVASSSSTADMRLAAAAVLPTVGEAKPSDGVSQRLSSAPLFQSNNQSNCMETEPAPYDANFPVSAAQQHQQ